MIMATAILDSRPLTVKQEAFTLRLFKGENQREAYIAVYHPHGSLASIDVAASELAHNPKVRVRLNTLRDALESPDIATVKERKQNLTKIQRATVADFVDENGNLAIESRAQLKTPAVAEIRTERTLVGIKTTLKLRDPVAAIQEHNRMERIGTQDSTTINFNEIKILVVREEPKQVTE